MNVIDPFDGLAQYYDGLMEHVDYGRWETVTTTLSELLPKRFRHLDVACGTGLLVRRLRERGWRSVGADLSPAMLHTARRETGRDLFAAADMCALPFSQSVHCITCLFDSINFLLDLEQVRQTLREFHAALVDGGWLYFDIVTERMIMEHFAGRAWTEYNGHFETAWQSTYDYTGNITDTIIRVNTGPACTLRERIYETADIEQAVTDAGFWLLGAVDAETWRTPRRRTTRVDFVAMKQVSNARVEQFSKLRDRIQRML